MKNIEEKGEAELVASQRDIQAMGIKERCPYVANPLEDCYCAELNSIRIMAIVRFCSGEFESCPVYRLQERVRDLSAEGLAVISGIDRSDVTGNQVPDSDGMRNKTD